MSLSLRAITGIVKDMKGTVQRFYFKKGFGFIEDEEGAEYFFHYTDFNGEKRDIETNTVVNFTAEEGEKGPCATNVSIYDESAGGGSEPLLSSKEWTVLIVGFVLGAVVGAAAVKYIL